MKKVLLFIFVFLLGITLTSCGSSEIAGTKTEGILVVGMECNYAPFNWTETTKTDSNVVISNLNNSYAEGYDVQMAKKIAEYLDMELQIKALEWDALIPSLKNGEIDMIIAGMSPTEERKQSISFSDGYYTSEEVLLVKKGSPYENATSLADFAGAKVAGQLGTLYADLVPQVVAQGAIAGTDLDTVPALVNQIKNGVLDATIVELPVAQGLCALNPELTFVQLTDGGFDVEITDIMVSIGVRKACNFLDEINAALATISEEVRNQMMLDAVSQQ